MSVLCFLAVNWGGNAVLRWGLERNYGLQLNAEVLILGHSHIMLALNKEILEQDLGVSISKYTREGVNVAERRLMAEQYLSSGTHDKLRLVIIGVDPYLFTRGGLSENSYINFYPFINNASIASYVRGNTTCGEYWKLRLLPLCRYNDTALNSAISGMLGRGGASMKTGLVDIQRVKRQISQGNYRHITWDAVAEAELEETIRLFTSRGVHVILFNTPLLDLYNELEPEEHQELNDYFKQCAAKNDLVEYWDASTLLEHDYSMFRDPIHLNRKGQEYVSRQVVIWLKDDSFGF